MLCCREKFPLTSPEQMFDWWSEPFILVNLILDLWTHSSCCCHQDAPALKSRTVLGWRSGVGSMAELHGGASGWGSWGSQSPWGGLPHKLWGWVGLLKEIAVDAHVLLSLILPSPLLSQRDTFDHIWRQDPHINDAPVAQRTWSTSTLISDVSGSTTVSRYVSSKWQEAFSGHYITCAVMAQMAL